MNDDHFDQRVLRALSLKNHSINAFARRFAMGADHAEAYLEFMVEKGLIAKSKTSRFVSYYVPPKVETDPRMPVPYQPEFREYRYDLGAFGRLCEGARNNERGMV